MSVNFQPPARGASISSPHKPPKYLTIIHYMQNNNDSHPSLSFSMAVTLHDHIISPVVFGNMYLFLIIIISDVRK